jgi:hypothetical protein
MEDWKLPWHEKDHQFWNCTFLYHFPQFTFIHIRVPETPNISDEPSCETVSLKEVTLLGVPFQYLKDLNEQQKSLVFWRSPYQSYAVTSHFDTFFEVIGFVTWTTKCNITPSSLWTGRTESQKKFMIVVVSVRFTSKTVCPERVANEDLTSSRFIKYSVNPSGEALHGVRP